MDLAELIVGLIIVGLVVYLFLYVILPLIPLPPPFAQIITAIVWVCVALYLIRLLSPILPHVRI